MVDKFYVVVLLLFVCFLCVYLGWTIGYDDAKKKYKKKGQLQNEY